MPPHLKLLDQKFVDIQAGKLKRLIVSLPPRHGKTEFLSKWGSMWFLGMNPDKRVILSAHTQSLADEQGRWVRNTAEAISEQTFGWRVAQDSSASNDWAIEGRKGGMLSVGVEQGIIGKGGDLVIIDDPYKNNDDAFSDLKRSRVFDWYRGSIRNRLEPGGAIVLVHQRWHEQDLTGQLLADGGEDWEVLSFPAIAEEEDVLGRVPGEALWPERFSVAELESIKKSVGMRFWVSQYQQRPGDCSSSEAEWPAEYFKSILVPSIPACKPRVRVLALDPSKGSDSKKGDYSAIVSLTVDQQGSGWVEADLQRRDVGRMVSDLVDAAVRLKPDAVVVETNGFQFLLRAEIDRVVADRGLKPLPIFEVSNSVKKTIRIARLGPLLSDGLLKVVDDVGGRLLVNQLREFPLGRHDDGPDALEMCCRVADDICASGGVSFDDGLGSVLPGCRVL